MKIFLAWSGEVSRKAAQAFHDWLPNVLQYVRPFMSEEDIAVGGRWSRQLDQELEESNYGIIFVTPDNNQKPWLLYEAGALSKSIDDSRVSPLLLGVERTELTGPLTHFQSALPSQEEIRRLLVSINSAAADSGLDDERLEHVATIWWPALEEQLSSVIGESGKASAGAPDQGRSERDIAGETLEVVRSLHRMLSDPTVLFPPDYVRQVIGDRAVPSLGPRAVEDLHGGLMQLRSLLSGLDLMEAPTMERRAELARTIEELQEPINYLINECGMRGVLSNPRQARRTGDRRNDFGP